MKGCAGPAGGLAAGGLGVRRLSYVLGRFVNNLQNPLRPIGQFAFKPSNHNTAKIVPLWTEV